MSAVMAAALTDQDKQNILWDEYQIATVMLRFGRALDTGNWSAYHSCFTDPVNIDFKRMTGFDEVRVKAADWTLFADQILSPTRRHHLYSNFDIEVHGDLATACVYMLSRHWKSTDLGHTSNTQYGWYNVWFQRTGIDWKIRRIKHDFQWIEGNCDLLNMADPELSKTMQRVFSQDNAKAAAAQLVSWQGES